MRLRAGIDSGTGGKGWSIARRTAKEELESGSGWKKGEEDYDGPDAVKVRNVHGCMTTLEGGWDGRELGLGGVLTHAEMTAAKEWRDQMVAKRKGASYNSFTGEVLGAAKGGPDSLVFGKVEALAREARVKAKEVATRQVHADTWGGSAPTEQEISAAAEIAAQKRNRKVTKKGKGLKGTGAPSPGM
jgi:hypothetical protein